MNPFNVDKKLYFVTRHRGALEWYQRHYAVCPVHTTVETTSHIDDAFMARLEPDDIVIGVMPMHIAAQVCAVTTNPVGILSMDRPEHGRSAAELSADEMETLNCRIQWFLCKDLTQIVEKHGAGYSGTGILQ